MTEIDSIPIGATASYDAGWSKLRGLVRGFWTVLLCGIPLALLVSFPAVHQWQTAFMCGWITLLAVMSWRYTSFRCPRCRKAFFRPNPFGYNFALRCCPHCGLKKG